MLTMGDEVLRSQDGNNNAYCQDNELSWFDWSAVEREAGMLRFTASLIAARRRAQELLDLPIDVTLEELLATARIDWHGVALGPAGSLVRLAKPRRHDQRPIGGAPHHRQRLLGAARLRAPASRGRARPGGASSTRRSHPRTTSASARRPRPSRQPPIGWVRAPSWSSPPGPPSPRRPTRDHPDDAARSGARADGRPRPPRGGSRRRQPVVPVGSVRGRAGVGHGARGLQRRRRRVVVLPARSRPFPGLPLERGRDGRAVRRVRAAVPRAGAVERPRPDPQGADVRPREQRGQPRRGRQGLLVVPRRAAVERLAALALPLSAGRIPVRGPPPRQPRTLEARGRVRAARHRRVRRAATGWSRSTTRRRTRPTS